MALWTDVIDPAELTGYVRASLEERERAKGSLGRFLPNVTVSDISARFRVGEAGLVPEATFRAFDAEIEVARGEDMRRVTIDLPAIGQNIPVSEYQQLRTRNASDEAIRNQILRTAERVVASVSDRIERMRGTVLVTGKATIEQPNFKSSDDFGRDSSLTTTAGTVWTDDNAKILDDMIAWADNYEKVSGQAPGRIVTSRKVMRLIARAKEFRTVLAGGGTQPASAETVNRILEDNGLPVLEVFTRRTSGGLVIPEDRLLLLPEPVDPNSQEGAELGASFWGQTLTSTDSTYGLTDDEQPGIVAGVYRGEKPPLIAEVIADAIALPVLANANLSAAAKVL